MAIQEIRTPDLEGAQDVGIVEIYVAVGEEVDIETPLISLESDKAVMDVPSPLKGIITELKVSEGDSLNTGDLIALAEIADDIKENSDTAKESPAVENAETAGKSSAAEISDSARISSTVEIADTDAKPSIEKKTDSQAINSAVPGSDSAGIGNSHATPSVRALARELGVDISRVRASGPKGRITREDLSSHVKSAMSGASAGQNASFGLPPIPGGNYADFGDVEVRDLSRIKKISGPHLHRNWIGIPHITQFEEADITELESFRASLNEEGRKRDETKISPLIFVIKAIVHSLKKFPEFNSSLDPEGTSITLKKYYNIGIAVDTPGGLVVPVIKNTDSKGIRLLADELADLSSRAREGKLKPDEMKGGTFTISSLGGIGGTSFTPIVNAPEVAILGLSRSAWKPVWNGREFLPRLILPLSLSYDHRVIDGAQGARFASYLASVIGDIRRALL